MKRLAILILSLALLGCTKGDFIVGTTWIQPKGFGSSTTITFNVVTGTMSGIYKGGVPYVEMFTYSYNHSKREGTMYVKLYGTCKKRSVKFGLAQSGTELWLNSKGNVFEKLF